MRSKARAKTVERWPSHDRGNKVARGAKNLPISWSLKEGKLRNVKWIAETRGKLLNNPIVAEGRVLIGVEGYAADNSCAFLKCFDESNGRLLLGAAPRLSSRVSRLTGIGFLSTLTVSAGRAYCTTLSCEVVCRSLKDGRLVWRYDLRKQLDVFPGPLDNCPIHGNDSSVLAVDDRVFVNTGNGADSEGKTHCPKAPSFVALDKETGKLLWQNSLPGAAIREGAWAPGFLAGGRLRLSMIEPCLFWIHTALFKRASVCSTGPTDARCLICIGRTLRRQLSCGAACFGHRDRSTMQQLKMRNANAFRLLCTG